MGPILDYTHKYNPVLKLGFVIAGGAGLMFVLVLKPDQPILLVLPAAHLLLCDVCCMLHCVCGIV